MKLCQVGLSLKAVEIAVGLHTGQHLTLKRSEFGMFCLVALLRRSGGKIVTKQQVATGTIRLLCAAGERWTEPAKKLAPNN